MVQMNKRRESSRGPACPPVEDLLRPELFRALGDPTRVAILAHLAGMCGPATVGQIACCTPVDVSVVSRHLATLREAGVVAAEKKGREVHYSVLYPELVRTLRAVADALEACCPAGPTRTKTRPAPRGGNRP